MTIRRQPLDFQVREVLSARFPLRPAPEPGVLHAIFELCKTSQTTPHACESFAATVGVPSRAVEYAGLKDKHAVTSQHVSIRLDRLEQTTALRREASGKDWTARLVGWAPRALAAEAIGRNHFVIVVRDLSSEQISAMQSRAASLARPAGSSLSIVNYFGDQRFVSARHGQGFAARHLIRGEFEHSLRLLIGTPSRGDRGDLAALTRACAAHWGDWTAVLAEIRPGAYRRALETLQRAGSFKDAFLALPHLDQQMAVEAYQSHLWNATARRLATDAAANRALITSDPFGELIFPPSDAVPGSWQGLDIPMPAPGVQPAGPWGQAMQSVLTAEHLKPDDLNIPGVRRPRFGSAMRPLLVEAESFQLSAADADEFSAGLARLKTTVEFSLPRGAYATVVLRALGQ